MAASVLGKRARGTESTFDESSVSSRVKRRLREPRRINDENVDPKTLNFRDAIEHDGDPMVVDENGDLCHTPSKMNSKTKIPTKIVVNHVRSVLSPTKVNGSGRVSISPQSNVLKLPRRCKDTKVSPPEPIQLPTPQTPRHRDALSKKVPITPRHRIGLLARPQLSPKTPKTPSTPGNNTTTVYNAARQLFTRSTEPGQLIGRNEERAELTSFIRNGIVAKTATGQRCMPPVPFSVFPVPSAPVSTLYVSGPPGTGKSALVGEVCRDFEGMENTRMAYLNCMSVKSSKAMYTKLIDALLGEETFPVKSEEEILKDLFLGNGRASLQQTTLTYIVTLDEIDALVPISPEVLYNLFAWSLAPRSHLVLIGIANALDLVDRFLPRLKAKNLRPQLLPFLPYTAKQIGEVITTKLQTLNESSDDQAFVPFLHPTAITFCAKKVASQTGDLRKAFDIVRRAIDVVGAETRQKQQVLGAQTTSPMKKSPLGENTNLASPPSSQSSPPPSLTLKALTALTAPRATIAHVAKVTSAALGQGASERLKALNLQQKAALCALLSLQPKPSTRHTSSLKRTANYIGSPFNDNNDDYDDSFPSTPLKCRTYATPSSSPSPKRQTAPTLRSLHATYTLLCTRSSSAAIQPLTATEFADVIAGLETMGLVSAEQSSLSLSSSMITPNKSWLVNRSMGSMTPTRKRNSGAGNGKEEKRLVASIERKEMEVALGEGVGGDMLRGLLRDEETKW